MWSNVLLYWMIQAIHCVAVFSLDVEHKEEDRRAAVKTEVRLLLHSVFVFSRGCKSQGVCHTTAVASFVRVKYPSCHKLWSLRLPAWSMAVLQLEQKHNSFSLTWQRAAIVAEMLNTTTFCTWLLQTGMLWIHQPNEQFSFVLWLTLDCRLIEWQVVRFLRGGLSVLHDYSWSGHFGKYTYSICFLAKRIFYTFILA